MDNFVVSARKYRPATFQSVIGQDHITSTLKNAIARGQLAHAYLFCGPRGVGKTTCARIFAKAINCLNPKDSEACNECESCRAFNEGRSFSIHELDAASNNSVEDIRNLTDQVRIPPQVGRYSVYIIDEVHMLSAAAFNAFLKTLEEPPAHAIFILATTEKHKIIPTILSRCQIYDFNRIKVEDVVKYLKYIASQEGVSFDDESLHIIAQKADGGMRDALSMYDKVVSFCNSNLTFKEVAATLNVLDYDTYFSATQNILNGDYTSELLLFDEVLRKGFSCQTFVAGLNNHFRDLLMCKDPKTLPLLEVTGSVAERYMNQAAQCSVPLLFGGINLLTQTDGALRTATSQRLTVELSLMKLCGLGQKKNNDTSIDQSPELSLPPLRKDVGGQTVAQSPAQVEARPVTQAVNQSGAAANISSVQTNTQQAAPATAQSHVVAGSVMGRMAPDTVTRRPAVSGSMNTPGEVNERMSGVAGGEIHAERVTDKGQVQHANGPALGQSSSPVYYPDKEITEGASETVREEASIPFPASAASVRQKQRFSFAGSSISAILNGDSASSVSEDDGEGGQDAQPEELDDKIEEKLTRACARFSNEL